MNIILQVIHKIQLFKSTHKKTYYLCLIGLWCMAPVEMLIFTIIRKTAYMLIHK